MRWTFRQATSPFLHQGNDTGSGVYWLLMLASGDGAAMGAMNGAARGPAGEPSMSPSPSMAAAAAALLGVSPAG